MTEGDTVSDANNEAMRGLRAAIEALGSDLGKHASNAFASEAAAHAANIARLDAETKAEEAQTALDKAVRKLAKVKTNVRVLREQLDESEAARAEEARMWAAIGDNEDRRKAAETAQRAAEARADAAEARVAELTKSENNLRQANAHLDSAWKDAITATREAKSDKAAMEQRAIIAERQIIDLAKAFDSERRDLTAVRDALGKRGDVAEKQIIEMATASGINRRDLTAARDTMKAERDGMEKRLNAAEKQIAEMARLLDDERRNLTAACDAAILRANRAEVLLTEHDIMPLL